MTARLSALSSSELAALGGEIARALDRTASSGWETAALWESARAAADTLAQAALPSGGAWDPAWAGISGAPGTGDRFASDAIPAADGRASPLFGAAEAGRGSAASAFRTGAESAEPASLSPAQLAPGGEARRSLSELSDCFRRDSRRYDAGFEKY